MAAASIHIHSSESRRHEGEAPEEADCHRKSSSCLGDGLGHALAAMVGPTWWSHGGVLEPRIEFIKVFCDNPPWKIPYYHLNQSTLVMKQ
jgi:hypothetical protein